MKSAFWPVVILITLIAAFLGRLEGYLEGEMARAGLPDKALPQQDRPPCPKPSVEKTLKEGTACFLPWPAGDDECRASPILYLADGQCWSAAMLLSRPDSVKP